MRKKTKMDRSGPSFAPEAGSTSNFELVMDLSETMFCFQLHAFHVLSVKYKSLTGTWDATEI